MVSGVAAGKMTRMKSFSFDGISETWATKPGSWSTMSSEFAYDVGSMSAKNA